MKSGMRGSGAVPPRHAPVAPRGPLGGAPGSAGPSLAARGAAAGSLLPSRSRREKPRSRREASRAVSVHTCYLKAGRFMEPLVACILCLLAMRSSAQGASKRAMQALGRAAGVPAQWTTLRPRPGPVTRRPRRSDDGGTRKKGAGKREDAMGTRSEAWQACRPGRG